MSSLLTSIDVPQGEKDLAKRASEELYKLLKSFETIVTDLKKVNNAIVNFPKEDPEEFKNRQQKFKEYKRWLNEVLKLFSNDLNKVLDALVPIKDTELARIAENILVNLDNVVELISSLYDLLENPTPDFKSAVGAKMGEVISRADDFSRMVKEELIDHLITNIVGTKRKIVSKYEKRRIERLARWHS